MSACQNPPAFNLYTSEAHPSQTAGVTIDNVKDNIQDKEMAPKRRGRASLELTIVTSPTVTTCTSVGREWTVLQLKEHLSTMRWFLCYRPEHQVISFESRVLLDDEMLSSIEGPERRATVHFTTCATHILVQMPAGNTIALDVLAGDHIRDIHARIFREEGVPPAKQLLIFEGKRLTEEWNTLSRSGVQDGSTLQLELAEGDLTKSQN